LDDVLSVPSWRKLFIPVYLIAFTLFVSRVLDIYQLDLNESKCKRIWAEFRSYIPWVIFLILLVCKLDEQLEWSWLVILLPIYLDIGINWILDCVHGALKYRGEEFMEFKQTQLGKLCCICFFMPFMVLLGVWLNYLSVMDKPFSFFLVFTPILIILCCLCTLFCCASCIDDNAQHHTEEDEKVPLSTPDDDTIPDEKSNHKNQYDTGHPDELHLAINKIEEDTAWANGQTPAIVPHNMDDPDEMD